MSTIKVNSIKNTSTNDGGIAIDNSGHVQVDGVQLPTAGTLSNRNLIINGACRVNQRQTTPSVGSANTFGPVDHFETRTSGDQWQGQISQETASVNNEFVSCLRVKTTTAETTVDGLNQVVVETHMEGQDIQHLFQGTSGAKPLTLSFWVRSSQTGTYVVRLYRPAGTRLINKTYTINAANTWEYKTLTFVGDTGGSATNDDANEGLRLGFQLAAGASFTSGSQPTTWTTYSNAVWAAGHTANSFMTTVNATWDVTGIQLEVGEKATSFEHRSYGDELVKCQRYYRQNGRMLGIWTSATGMRFTHQFAPHMRTSPTVTLLNTNGYHERYNVNGYAGISNIGGVYGDNKSQDFAIVSDSNRGRSYDDTAMLGQDVVSFTAEL